MEFKCATKLIRFIWTWRCSLFPSKFITRWIEYNSGKCVWGCVIKVHISYFSAFQTDSEPRKFIIGCWLFVTICREKELGSIFLLYTSTLITNRASHHQRKNHWEMWYVQHNALVKSAWKIKVDGISLERKLKLTWKCFDDSRTHNCQALLKISDQF